MTDHYGMPDGLPQGDRRISAEDFIATVEARDDAPARAASHWFAPVRPADPAPEHTGGCSFMLNADRPCNCGAEKTAPPIPGWHDPAAISSFAVTDDGGTLWLEHLKSPGAEEGCPVLSIEVGLTLADLITAAATHQAEGC
jgi:hypothetical protein